MPATPQQFLKEANAILKLLYIKHSASRSDFKEAVEAVSIAKMPRSTEKDRRKFVNFAMICYDLMRKSGFDPNTSIPSMGRALANRPRNGISITISE